MDKKIIFLHVIHDDKKFFPGSLNVFDKDERLVNKCVLIVKKEQDAFLSIEKTDRVKVLVGIKGVKEFFENEEFDVAYFHSMSYIYWPYLHFIPEEKKIIWWAWGYDVYSGYFFRPILPIALYKRETRKAMYRKGLVRRPKNFIAGIRYGFLKKNVLKRVDYFQPVVEEEYNLLQGFHENIRAKIFFPSQYITASNEEVVLKKPNGHILIGNSASATNNHLDLLNELNRVNLRGRRIIIPLNYGSKKYGDFIESNACIEGNEVVCLRDFLPRVEYFQLMGNCSYAIYGVLRQQAMGNIYHGLWDGIKIFLYKDSVVYKHLKNNNFIVFTIEDIDERQLLTPLTREEIKWNRNQYLILKEKRNGIYNEVIEELLAEKYK